MSWHLVHGVPLPDPVAGHPALDFCNTRAGWGSPAPKEYLTRPAAVLLWAIDAGLLPPPFAAPSCDLPPETTVDPVAELGLRRAHALREALYPCALGDGTASDWALVAREATAARAASSLEPGPDGARWRLRPDGAAPTLLALHAIAASAETLLISPLAACVAACPGAGCGWLFADPRRRRRWCSMAVCGNRAKARRFAGSRRQGRSDALLGDRSHSRSGPSAE
ncbi:MAG TPA: ABATE domain-containing protein [Kineosporiaceae bacterium]|jgi:predicted RNA-binding Zn ribbon-like protein|nr:ABATE domain-containing protein [Kineosporiaceae bacterium]